MYGVTSSIWTSVELSASVFFASSSEWTAGTSISVCSDQPPSRFSVAFSTTRADTRPSVFSALVHSADTCSVASSACSSPITRAASAFFPRLPLFDLLSTSELTSSTPVFTTSRLPPRARVDREGTELVEEISCLELVEEISCLKLVEEISCFLVGEGARCGLTV